MKIVIVYRHEDGRLAALSQVRELYAADNMEVEVIQAPDELVFSFTRTVREYLGEYDGIVMVCDADCYVPRRQIVQAEALCRKGYIMVSPYDGMVVEKECGAVLGRVIRNDGRGGAVVLNYRPYREICRGENPNFRLWGDEDHERWERVSKFMRIPRVSGPIFHYAHPKADPGHPYAQDNLNELNKARVMSCEQIEEYVKTWR